MGVRKKGKGRMDSLSHEAESHLTSREEINSGSQIFNYIPREKVMEGETDKLLLCGKLIWEIESE